MTILVYSHGNGFCAELRAPETPLSPIGSGRTHAAATIDLFRRLLLLHPDEQPGTDDLETTIVLQLVDVNDKTTVWDTQEIPYRTTKIER